MRPGERNLMLIFLALALGGALFSLDFDLPEARLFPLITGVITSVLIVAYFVVMSIPALKEPLNAYLEDDIFMKISAAADGIGEAEAEEAAAISHPRSEVPDPVRRRRELILFAYLGGFGLLAWIVGLAIASPIFLFAVIYGYSRDSLKRAVFVTVATTLFLHVMFVEVLRLRPHFGLLRNLF